MKTLVARLEAEALEDGAFEVAEVVGKEAMSSPYEFAIRIVGAPGKTLDEDALLSAPVRLLLEQDGERVRAVHGLVQKIESGIHGETGSVEWTLTLVPRLQQLALTSTTEVLMDMNVTEIVESRLERAGLAVGDDYEVSVGGTYAKREFVVQFKESDLDFVNRLTEHVGVTYFFRQDEDREVVVFVDDNGALSTEADGLSVPFRARGERMDVFELRSVTTAMPAKVRVKDYNYRTPKVELKGEAETQGSTGETFEYGAHFKTPDEASQLAKTRAEEVAWQRRVIHAKSARPELSPGTRFKLEGHPLGDKDLLIIDVEHVLRQAVFSSGGGENAYENRFTAIEANVPFRPLRKTLKPFVPGVLTGIVEAAAEGEYADVDGDGRYHVRFSFDVGNAERGKASRPVRMAQPHAGQGYGFHFPLRDGVEVVLACVEGDPDRPIISGAVPNPTTPSTVASKNAARNVIRTGGGTEINIDDTEGSERVKISVPYANTILQLGAPNQPVKGVYLGTDEKITVKSDNGMDFTDSTDITGEAPDVHWHGTTNASIKGDSHAVVESGAKVSIKAPTILNEGTLHQEQADVINSVASATWTATAGALATIHGGSTVTVTSAVVTISAGIITIAGDTVSVSGTGAVNVTAPSVNIGDGDVTIKGGGSVTIEGPAVNVTGTPIKLN